jgi:uridylate kinase
MKKIIVISLGGSLIIPDEIDFKFLREFKKVILENSKKYKFIIVCGGGSIARKYIHALRKLGASIDLQDFAGISATRMNARFVSYFFNTGFLLKLPYRLPTLKRYLKNQDIVICGALERRPNQTTDSSAAHIAGELKSDFINLTNVKGLYTKNPSIHKDAKFISKISWQNFIREANKSKFKPGQHFVLDQTASKKILKYKTKTYIIGKNPKQLDNALKNKKFIGTIIYG